MIVWYRWVPMCLPCIRAQKPGLPNACHSGKLARLAASRTSRLCPVVFAPRARLRQAFSRTLSPGLLFNGAKTYVPYGSCYHARGARIFFSSEAPSVDWLP